MQIALLSDMHLSFKEKLFYGVDVKTNYLKTLAQIKTIKPDVILYLGDFCKDKPEDQVYKFVKDETDKLSIPWFAIPGNHDSTQMMTQQFNLPFLAATHEICYGINIGNVSLLFCDSSSGRLSIDQYLWLEQNCSVDIPVMLFTHYPPVECGCTYMDNHHRFNDKVSFREFLLKHPAITQIYSGHYHTAKDLIWEKVSIHLTPATCFQINQNANEMVIDSKEPAFRLIVIEENYIENKVITNY